MSDQIITTPRAERQLIRNELIKLKGDEIITVTFPNGAIRLITAFNLLDTIAMKIKLPDQRNLRDTPSIHGKLLAKFTKGTELWIYRFQTPDGYSQAIDYNGWLFTDNIKIFG